MTSGVIRKARGGIGATAPGKPLEKDIQRQIVDYLKRTSWEVMELRERFAGRPSDPGIPDLVAIKGGRTMWLEVKRPGGRVRDSQIMRHRAMRLCGSEVHIVRSVEDVVHAIKHPEEGTMRCSD